MDKETGAKDMIPYTERIFTTMPSTAMLWSEISQQFNCDSNHKVI
jgi:hypothetical protein